MLYILTSIWVLLTPSLVEIVIFSVFCAKKLKKAKNLPQNCAKNTFFKFAPERWSTDIFIGGLNNIYEIKHCLTHVKDFLLGTVIPDIDIEVDYLRSEQIV